MPKQRMDLRMIKDIIRLKWQSQLSHEQIAMALNVSKGVVSKYLSLASAAGLDWGAAASLDERQLTLRLLPRSHASIHGPCCWPCCWPACCPCACCTCCCCLPRWRSLALALKQGEGPRALLR